MFSFLIRVILLFMGLLFAAGLAMAALVMVALWMVRAGWARLTGKPLTPWTAMFVNQFDPRAGFERFRAAAARQGGPSAADVTSARARGESVRSPVANIGSGRDDVTDVRARPIAGQD
ncbi:MAG: hypothetical protein DI563_27545 [Variovorax paradoxus]|uniref:Uncharacterized protein n=1 Tax=Variovorax paradoxus TaxID=34073 RepID=A0A2W5PCV4_VARPD|nr:MAG: hypothetical protein DI563_27545 [Variovorax paradoxus]